MVVMIGETDGQAHHGRDDRQCQSQQQLAAQKGIPHLRDLLAQMHEVVAIAGRSQVIQLINDTPGILDQVKRGHQNKNQPEGS